MATISTINVGGTEYKFDYDGCVENGPVPVPECGTSDEGKVLTVSDGGLSWEEWSGGGDELPTHDSLDVGKVLTIAEGGSLVWEESGSATIPTATTSTLGCVTVDGVTIIADDGEISVPSEKLLPSHTASDNGRVLKVDNNVPTWEFAGEVPWPSSGVDDYKFLRTDGSNTYWDNVLPTTSSTDMLLKTDDYGSPQWCSPLDIGVPPVTGSDNMILVSSANNGPTWRTAAEVNAILGGA